MKVVIVGTTAGGLTCAARLRSLDEKAEIVLVERGPHVACATRGPSSLIPGADAWPSIATMTGAESLRGDFAIDVRIGCEATSVSATNSTIDLRSLVTGEVTTESYDRLVISGGARRVRPSLPGIELAGILDVRTVADLPAVVEWCERGTSRLPGDRGVSGVPFERPTRRAMVIGSGLIGFQAAEKLMESGFEVTLVERLARVLSSLDREFVGLVEKHVARHGMRFTPGDDAVGFKPRDDGAIDVRMGSGTTCPVDVVILALGVRPDTALARSAGLKIGEHGGAQVDGHMRTSDPDIFAIGDAVEVRDALTGKWNVTTLPGQADRQGRIAADVIAGRDCRYHGTQGTSTIGLCGGAAAWTGVSEETLERHGDTDYEKIYLFADSRVGCTPGERPLALKVIFRRSDGRVLGAQAVGEDGPAVDKHISALALAIHMGATIHDLEDAELCDASQVGCARDAINFAGMAAADVLDGDLPLAHWDSVDGAFLLDVRESVELDGDHVPGAIRIPFPELRARLDELPRNREVLVVSRLAQQAYYATRTLVQHGFTARAISGGTLARAVLALRG
jgi:NADPH-dependent 2,4-dienoyl-CoA reductase/sulfur reductase-like enzyme/rhodanese-related sulfurtransferase